MEVNVTLNAKLMLEHGQFPRGLRVVLVRVKPEKDILERFCFSCFRATAVGAAAESIARPRFQVRFASVEMASLDGVPIEGGNLLALIAQQVLAGPEIVHELVEQPNLFAPYWAANPAQDERRRGQPAREQLFAGRAFLVAWNCVEPHSCATAFCLRWIIWE